jgi:hypothetical protein
MAEQQPPIHSQVAQELYEQWQTLNHAAQEAQQDFFDPDTDEAVAFRKKEQAADNLSRFMRNTPGSSVVHDIRLQQKG